jgi:hypothetical protein
MLSILSICPPDINPLRIKKLKNNGKLFKNGLKKYAIASMIVEISMMRLNPIFVDIRPQRYMPNDHDNRLAVVNKPKVVPVKDSW